MVYRSTIALIFACLIVAANLREAQAQLCPDADRISRYVSQLEQLFEKERRSIIPYLRLNKLYFPFRDCDLKAISERFQQSRFYKHGMPLNPLSDDRHSFLLGNGAIKVGFAYLKSEKRSELDYVLLDK